MSRLKRILKAWFPLAVVVVLLAATVYGIAQQVLRQSANDPQIWMAEDAATAFENGKSIDSVVPASQIDISTSRAPFLVVYDDSGKPIAASGLLHGDLPVVPLGSLRSSRDYGENRITWQPESGVRIAAVITRVATRTPGYVLAGRSLKDVEDRIFNVEMLTGFCALVTLFATLVAVVAADFVL